MQPPRLKLYSQERVWIWMILPEIHLNRCVYSLEHFSQLLHLLLLLLLLWFAKFFHGFSAFVSRLIFPLYYCIAKKDYFAIDCWQDFDISWIGGENKFLCIFLLHFLPLFGILFVPYLLWTSMHKISFTKDSFFVDRREHLFF